MAEHEEDIDTLELDTEEQQDDPDNQEDDTGSEQDDSGASDDGGEDEDEFSIEIGGEEQEPEETPLQKELRAKLRDALKENHELRKQAQSSTAIVVGDEPTLESCDYDDELFKSEFLAWAERKRQAEQQDQQAQQVASARQEQFNRKVTTYQASLARLPMPQEEKEAAQNAVVTALPTILQSAIVEYADDPAKVVVALAKHPAKLAKLAAIEDPIAFVIAMKDMERNLKVVNRRRPPAPEADTIQRGSASNVGYDKQLEKLEKEAARTNDRSKIIAFKAARKQN